MALKSIQGWDEIRARQKSKPAPRGLHLAAARETGLNSQSMAVADDYQRR
jgi:hypothetical protein